MKLKVGILGAATPFGQKLGSLLEHHRSFEVVALSQGSKDNRDEIGADKIARNVDFLFSAIEAENPWRRDAELAYVKRHRPVITINHTWADDGSVPTICFARSDVFSGFSFYNFSKRKKQLNYGFMANIVGPQPICAEDLLDFAQLLCIKGYLRQFQAEYFQ